VSKYQAQRTVADGLTFASKREASRYHMLVLLQKQGLISGLQMQVKFELAPGCHLNGRRKPPVRYFADFVYTDCVKGSRIVEDAKGVSTPLYRLKKHLMKTVHGIEVTEV
jgi:hypothetical protein